jgi:hypothetical protein
MTEILMAVEIRAFLAIDTFLQNFWLRLERF